MFKIKFMNDLTPFLRGTIIFVALLSLGMAISMYLIPLPKDDAYILASILRWITVMIFWWCSGLFFLVSITDIDFLSEQLAESFSLAALGPIVIIPLGFAYFYSPELLEELKIKFCPRSALPLYVGHDFISKKAEKTFLKRIKNVKISSIYGKN